MGPMGMGPMTGRGMGCCAGYALPGNANAGFSMGRGRGFRRMYQMTGLPGWARNDVSPYDSKTDADRGEEAELDEKQVLKDRAELLEKQLKEVRTRLKGFEKDK